MTLVPRCVVLEAAVESAEQSVDQTDRLELRARSLDLAVLSVPKELARDGEMTNFLDTKRWAAIYTADHLDDAAQKIVKAVKEAR